MAGMAGAGVFFGLLRENNENANRSGSVTDSSGENRDEGKPAVDKPANDKPATDRPPGGDKPIVPVKPKGPLADDVLQRMKKATVFVHRLGKEREPLGSGFVCLGPDLVVSSAQALGVHEEGAAIPGELGLTLNNGTKDEVTATGRLVGIDRKANLVVLRVENRPAKVAWPAPLPVVPAAQLRETSIVYVLGYPFGDDLGKEITISKSSITGSRSGAEEGLSILQLGGQVNQGVSGGPVFDETGNVVGVALPGFDDSLISFAVPGENVQALGNGRMTFRRMQDRTSGDQRTVVAQMNFVNPLQNLRDVEIDWWFGDPVEMPTQKNAKALPQPGEGPRTTTACPLMRDGTTVETHLPMPSTLEPGKLLWSQAHWTDGTGKRHWEPAMPHEIMVPPTPERLVVTVKRKPDRTPLTIVSSAEFILADNKRSRTVHRKISARFWEDLRSIEENQVAWTYYTVAGPFDIRLYRDGVIVDPPTNVRQIVTDADKLGLVVASDGGKTMHKWMLDKRRVPPASLPLLSTFAEQLFDSLDIGLVPLPAGEIQPGATWKLGKVIPVESPLTGDVLKFPLEVNATYVGTRRYGKEKRAVIYLQGTLKPATPEDNGSGEGEALLDAETGRVIEVNFTTGARFELRLHTKFRVSNARFRTVIKRGPASELPQDLPTLDEAKYGGELLPPSPPLPPGKPPLRQIRQFVGQPWPAGALAFSPDGRWFASCGNMICIWEVATGKLVTRIKEEGGYQVRALVFSKDGSLLLAGGTTASGREARVYLTADGTVVSKFNGHRQSILSAWLSPDGKIAATGSNDDRIRVWDVQTGNELRVLDPGLGGINAIFVASDGREALIGGRAVCVIDFQSAKILRTIEPAGLLAALPDGKHFAIGDARGVIRLHNLATGGEIKKLHGHEGIIQQLSINADGTRLLSTATDEKSILWDLTEYKPVATLEVQGGYGGTIISPDGKSFANFRGIREHSLFELVKER